MKNEIIKSSPTKKPKKLLIIIRHGERKDRTGETPSFHVMNSELSEKGKVQSFNASKIFFEEIKKYGYGIDEISPDIIQIRTSPYMRTIQTAVYFIKGLNEIISLNNKNISNKNNIFKRIYIDYPLRKTIKKNQKKEGEDSSLYSSIEKYQHFDEEIKQIELIKKEGNFPTEVETKEESEKRTIYYINNDLKKEIEDINNKNKNKIIIVVGHRGPIKFFFKRLGYVCTDKKEVEYCSQFYFDVSDGIDKSVFLGKQKLSKNLSQ